MRKYRQAEKEIDAEREDHFFGAYAPKNFRAPRAHTPVLIARSNS